MSQKVGPEMLEDSMSTFVFSEKISAPSNGVIPLHLNTGPRFQLLSIVTSVGSGSLTLDVQVNSGSGLANMPDFNNISVTTSGATVNGDGDADDIIPEGSILALNIRSASGPPAAFIATFVGKVLPSV